MPLRSLPRFIKKLLLLFTRTFIFIIFNLMIKAISLICSLLFFSYCYAQNIDLSHIKKLPAKLNFENNCNGSPELKNTKKDQVAILFFQDFTDSVIIQVNQKTIASRFVRHDDNLLSTDFTGLNFTQNYPDSLNTIRLIYVKEASYIEFNLDKSYPFYSIHFNKPRTYFVTGHKCMLSLK